MLCCRKVVSFVAAIAFLIIFSSCEGKIKTIKKQEQPQSTVEVGQEQTPQLEVEKKHKASYFGYNPIGKRDPFQPYISEESRPAVTLTPLQTFDIDQLRLVAIIWDISDPRAMAEDPSGRGYILKKGTLVGKNWGRVTQIEKGQVIISEEYRSISGDLIVNQVVMKLSEKE